MVAGLERDGGVHIRRRDGSTFIPRPEIAAGPSLDLPGLGLSRGRREILEAVQEGRRQV